MEIKTLEKSDEKLKIEIDDLTLVNLVNENLWKQKIDYAAYAKDHPYLSKPVLLVKSKEPKKSLKSAAERVIKDVEELRKKFEKEIKE